MVLCLVDIGFWHAGRALAFAEPVCHPPISRWQILIGTARFHTAKSHFSGGSNGLKDNKLKKAWKKTSDQDVFETISTQCYKTLSHWV